MQTAADEDQVVAGASIAALVNRQAVQDIIQSTAALLDKEDLEGWLAHFHQESEYRLIAYSAELRQQVTWWKASQKELAKQLQEVPQHVRDPARRFHLVSPSRIDLKGTRAFSSSAFAIFRTLPSGETHFYAAGRYEDQLIREGGKWLYTSHIAHVDTRVFESLTHLPL